MECKSVVLSGEKLMLPRFPPNPQIQICSSRSVEWGELFSLDGSSFYLLGGDL